jgi:asparagine synthase (glutamine-hydrolysing)
VCGIAGVLDPAGADPTDVERQLRLLAHRGPDAAGVYARGPAAIGQNRLAVIDLVHGDPPIANEDGSVGVALNGEVYNYRALRDELRRDGHRLATEGDTEVIAHLAESLEPVALARRLDGMFAFAVWDARRERLVLARDRLGKKPLHFWMQGGRLAFASEIKAVLAAPGVPRRLNADVIPAYLAFGYPPTPRTFFAGVQSLPPGHVLVAEGDVVRVEPYWEPRVPGPPGGVSRLDLSLADAARAVRAQLTEAVRRRLVADVPVGAFLSGGVDSSAVVGIMAALSDEPVRTFSIGFDDPDGFDERPYARAVARRFGTEHVELVAEPDAVNLVERLVWHHDQPFGDSSAVPTFLLCELTRGHVTVALTGDGGDELFAGYRRFPAALAAGRLARLLGPVGGRLARRLPRGEAGRFLTHAGRGLPDAYREWVSYVGPEWRRALVGRANGDGSEDYRRIWDATRGADTLDRLLDLNLRTYLLDDLLPKVDRASMAHGLEVRSPLLDHELVELALRLPRAARVRGLARKRALRAAVADLLPRETLRRRKRGFAMPLDRWFRTDLRAYLQGTLGAPDARVRQHLAPGPLDDLIAEHQAGASHGHALWTLLTLEAFLRREGW